MSITQWRVKRALQGRLEQWLILGLILGLFLRLILAGVRRLAG
jgi:Tfp pilus assembly protein PilN